MNASKTLILWRELMLHHRRCSPIPKSLLSVLAALLIPVVSQAASWTKLTNQAPAGAGVMLQLTDGSVMVQSGTSAGWMKLTPNASGSYANGDWTKNPVNPMSMPRLYFASVILPDGRVWVLGGEYTDAALDSNWSPTGEIYDPVANSWSPIAPYPDQTGCPQVTATTTGNTTAGSPIITGIPNTDGLQTGKGVSGTPIPAGSTIVSVDSPSQVHISLTATATATGATLRFVSVLRPACFGDVPAILLSSGQILAGNLSNRSTYIYNVATNSWVAAGNKSYNDRSDEESWTKLPDGRIITYDIFRSIAAGTGYAEVYNPVTNLWSGISPADGSAGGVLPLLSSGQLGDELGPMLRLQDGRIFVVGANNHTALYDVSANTWAVGPDITGTLNGNNASFGADDAPAAIMPNGHVLLAADAGPAAVSTTGDTTAGSPIVSGIPSTSVFQTGWSVTGPGIPANSTVSTVDSPTQARISNNATITATGVALRFGGTFSRPTQIFDFDPAAGTILPISPSIPDPGLNTNPAYIARMLVLPTGQVLFGDGSRQLYIYTPDGPVNPAMRPVLNQVVYSGGGIFTLTGKQLNGQSAGSSYGDDVESDQNFPVVRLVNSTGQVYYCRTTNWSSTGVAGGSAPETVDFTLNSSLPAGNYALIASGAGISSFPLFVNITQSEVNGQ